MSAIYILPAGFTLTVSAADGQSAHAQQLEDASIAEFAPYAFGPYFVDRQFVVTGEGSAVVSEQPVDPSDLNLDGGTVGITDAYSGTGSYQTIWADLELDADAGSDEPTNPKFLGPIMGNIMGADVAGEANYLGGCIGAYSITGAGGSLFPKAAVMGIVMAGSTDADACFVAVIDGSDPAQETRARAAFGVAVVSDDATSGVDYGLDLVCAPLDDSFSGTAQGLNVEKAQIRFSVGDVCLIVAAGAPVDYTDGSPPATGEGYAGIGSEYINTTTGKHYFNCGTKAEPLWKIVTSA